MECLKDLWKRKLNLKYEDEVNGEYYSTPKYLVRPSGYQFVDENGNIINAQKIVLEKKKKEYPKTYEECCKTLMLTNKELLEASIMWFNKIAKLAEERKTNIGISIDSEQVLEEIAALAKRSSYNITRLINDE